VTVVATSDGRQGAVEAAGRVTGIIDCAIHHTWASPRDVLPFMSEARRAFLGQSRFVPKRTYDRPGGNALSSSFPANGVPGSDVEQFVEDVLVANGVGRAMLTHDLGMLVPALADPYLAADVIRAVNDWTVERWLGATDDRVHAALLVHTQLPAFAEAEIDRLAAVDRISAVLLCANGMAKPFGHPAYHPILAKAAEAGLPVIVHAGGDAIPDTPSTPTGGGLPSLYTEAHGLAGQWIAAQLTVMVSQGVFEKFPGLRVLFVGGGVGWLPWLLWRMDISRSHFRWELPWLEQRPSDYVLRNVWLATYPLDSAHQPATVGRWLETLPGIERRICYASGYPSWDAVRPDEVRAALPEAWWDGVLRDNAGACFGWSTAPGPDTAVEV